MGSLERDYGNVVEASRSGKGYGGWAAWSQWGSCSASCGGGIRHRLRRCLGHQCPGPSLLQTVCNSHRCPRGRSFRDERCSEFNQVPYRGYVYDTWLGVESSSEPCALLCRASVAGFTARLQPRLPDGTACRNGSAVCLAGKCTDVGCDGGVGSSTEKDECGVCAGDGSTCGRPVFRWKDTHQFSHHCSTGCGPKNFRVSVSVCVEGRRRSRVVPERFCADKARPRPVVERCPYRPCPTE